MSKKVEEKEFKFYLTHLDVLMNQHFILKRVDVEDNSPPESFDTSVDVSTLPDRYQAMDREFTYRYKSITRKAEDGSLYLEWFYIRVS